MTGFVDLNLKCPLILDNSSNFNEQFGFHAHLS